MKNTTRQRKIYAKPLDKMWLLYDVIVDTAWQMARDILKNQGNTADKTERSVALQIIGIRTNFDRWLKEHPYVIHPGWAMSAGKRADVIYHDVFNEPQGAPVHPHFYTMATAYGRLCGDLIECFPGQPNCIETWSSLQVLLGQIAGFVEDRKDSAPDPDILYNGLKSVFLEGVKPPKEMAAIAAKTKKLSLYEAFGDTIVLAANRAEAKSLLQRLKGWYATGKDLSGISPGEKFGDGRTCADVIEQYRADAPCIIGASA